jgi:hypothetical protein
MSSPPSSSTDTGAGAGPEPRTAPDLPPRRGSFLNVALTLSFLALLVWGFNPRRMHIKPAPLDPATALCTPSKAEFQPSNLTEIPGVPLDGLADRVKNRILLRLNMEPCTCGCAQSLASCRAGNPQCPASPHTVDPIVREEQDGTVSGPPRKPASPR